MSNDEKTPASESGVFTEAHAAELDALDNPADKPSEAPLCYGIVNAAGKMWMSESCISEDGSGIDDGELEFAQEKDPTYRIVPLFARSAIPLTGHCGTRWEVGADGNMVTLFFDSVANMEELLKALRTGSDRGGKK